MNRQPYDIKNIELALQQFLFETPTQEEGLMVLLKNPQLFTEFVETLFELLIADAKKQGKDELVKFYRGRRLLLQAVKQSLSDKDIALLQAVRQILLKKDLPTTDSPSTGVQKRTFDFQGIMVKVLTWLKAPTVEKRISVLQQHPELLTDKTERMFSLLIDEANHYGDKMFIQILRTISEIFRMMRLRLIDKNGAAASQDDLKKAVEYALDHTDFSIFGKDKQTAVFIA